MPKMKSCSAAKKRFNKKSNSLVKASRAFRRHLLTKKTAKRKRHMRSAFYVHASDLRAITRLLPY